MFHEVTKLSHTDVCRFIVVGHKTFSINTDQNQIHKCQNLRHWNAKALKYDLG